MKALMNYMRIRDWWNYIIPPILGWFFLSAWFYQIPTRTVLSTGFLLWLISIATAAFGFLLNDLSDIEEDRLKGRENAITGVPKVRVIAFLVFLLVLQAVLLYLLQPGRLLWVHILQISVLVLYSAEPFRLKRIWWLAPVLDATFSGTLYFIFAYFILPVQTGIGIEYGWLIFIFVWGICRGLRNILSHMFANADVDRKAGLNTIIHQKNMTWRDMDIVVSILNLIEVALFIVLVFSQKGLNYIWWITAGLFLIYIQWKKQRNGDSSFTINNLLLEVYLPVMSIVALYSSGGPVFILLLVIVTFIYPSIMSWFIALFLRIRDLLTGVIR